MICCHIIKVTKLSVATTGALCSIGEDILIRWEWFHDMTDTQSSGIGGIEDIETSLMLHCGFSYTSCFLIS